MAARVPVATDDFNRADAFSLGSNWSPSAESTSSGNTPDIVSNQAVNYGGTDNDMFWNADSFENNQYSKVTITGINTGTDDYSGVIVRADASDYVMFQHNKFSGTHNIYWYNGGAYTSLGSASQSPSVSDVLVLEVFGTSFIGIRNGIVLVSGSNGSVPSSGAAGIIIAGTNDGESALDDWEGGNFLSNSIPTASADDGEENVSTTTVDISSLDYELTYDGHQQIVGIRFPNVSITQGYTVTEAILRLVAKEAHTGTLVVSVYGEDTDDSAQYTTTNGNISGRTLTTAVKSWDLGTTTGSVVGEIFEVDVTDEIQEIVNRGGFSSGNAISLIIKDGTTSNFRTAYSYDGSSILAGRLFYNSTAPSTTRRYSLTTLGVG